MWGPGTMARAMPGQHLTSGAEHPRSGHHATSGNYGHPHQPAMAADKAGRDSQKEIKEEPKVSQRGRVMALFVPWSFHSPSPSADILPPFQHRSIKSVRFRSGNGDSPRKVKISSDDFSDSLDVMAVGLLKFSNIVKF